MHLLNRLLRWSCLAALAGLLPAAIAWGQSAGGAPDGEPAVDPAGQLEFTELPPLPEQPAEEEELPDIRRRPPRTDEEEQKYKLFKFQIDPFLMPPPPATGEPVYSPYDWLRPVDTDDAATYVVQDGTGNVIGHLTLVVSQVDGGPAGALVQLTALHDYRQPYETRTWLKPRTLEPVAFMRFNNPAGRATGGNNVPENGVVAIDAAPHFRADYLYDRASVELNSGGFITRGRFRLLPYAFDVSSLGLLVRQLDFRHPNWPFVATSCDPQLQQTRQLVVEKPRRVTTMSIEPATYNCFELSVQVDTARDRWWVERVPPHRLVKFTGGGLTYTLAGLLER